MIGTRDEDNAWSEGPAPHLVTSGGALPVLVPILVRQLLAKPSFGLPNLLDAAHGISGHVLGPVCALPLDLTLDITITGTEPLLDFKDHIMPP